MKTWKQRTVEFITINSSNFPFELTSRQSSVILIALCTEFNILTSFKSLRSAWLEKFCRSEQTEGTDR